MVLVKDMVTALRAKGFTTSDIARVLDVSWWSVYRWGRGARTTPGNFRRLHALHVKVCVTEDEVSR